MATQQEYDDLLRKVKAKRAKDWEIEKLARSWWGVAGAFGNDVRRELSERRKEHGPFGATVDTVLKKGSAAPVGDI